MSKERNFQGLKISLFLSICLVLLPTIVSPNPINVWPMPRSFQWPKLGSRRLSGDFAVIIPNNHRHLFAAAARCRDMALTERHRPIVSPSINSANPPLKKLIVSVCELDAPLVHDTDESYTLRIPAVGPARISSRTPWGAMRGFDTFLQLVWNDDDNDDDDDDDDSDVVVVVASGVNISDAPVFGHRGILLDTSRNYYPVEDILRTISAIGMNKLNVFHWHITDSHSFPLVLPSEPKLAEEGSYRSDMQYSPEDVTRIVDFGFDHGVRVIPEIDTPAHTGSWAEAYPEIVTCADKFWWPAGAKWEDRYASEPGSGQLNPLNPNTYKVFKNVVNDTATLFPEPFFHAGADEVTPNCWRSDPAISAFLSLNGTLSQLLEKYINNTLPHILSLNKTVIYWEDVLLDKVISVKPASLPRSRTIIQTWNNGHNNTKKLASMGYRVIVSSSEFYYLDCGHGGFTGNNSIYNVQTGNGGVDGGSWCGPFKTWQTIYNYDILYGLTPKEAKLVIGAEVALWSEQADGTVLDSRVWPRASALAESLWSGNKDRAGFATDRLSEWRRRMVGRGIGAEPIQPLWCAYNPGMCNTLNSQ